MESNSVQIVKIDLDHVDQRVDNFLLARLKGLPRSRVYKLLRSGEIRVNKKRVKPEYRLDKHDEVRIPPVRLPEQVEIKPSAHASKLLEDSILFEDEKVIIINKPAGFAVHAGSGVHYGVIEAFKVMKPEYPALELVHRLDRDTSGCLILAKKRNVLKLLHEAFREHQVKKTYLALTMGHWSKKQLRVDAPLKRFQLKSGERMVCVDQREGKESLTLFTSKQRFDNAELLEVRPQTGRTHQIRVHCQYVGHPIVGDNKYGDKAFDRKMKEDAGCNRLFLHASRIELNLPECQFKVDAPLPSDCKKIIEAL